MVVEDKAAAPVGGKVPYAAGWVVAEDSELADGRLLHHNGSNGLWLAKIGVAPDQNTAFVCVSNFFDVGRADLVCEGVFEHIAHFTPLHPPKD